MKKYSFKNLDFENKNKKNSKKNLTNIIQKHFNGNKKDGQIISNANINIVSVIKNILENIEDEQKNGKSNLQYVNLSSQRQRKMNLNNKTAIDKLISYTPRKKFSLNINSPSKRGSKLLLSKNESFSKHLSKKKIYSLKEINKKNKVKFKNEDMNLNISSEKYKVKSKGYQSSIKRSGKVNSFFFKPKNKLKAKWSSTKELLKNASSNSGKEVYFFKNYKAIKSPNDNNERTLLLFSKSKYGSDNSLITKPKNRVIKGGKYKSEISPSTLSKNKSQNKFNLNPFSQLEHNIKISSKILEQKLYEYENNEITHEINQLPGQTKKKLIKKIKAIKSEKLLTKYLKKKPFIENYKKNMKQYNKEIKYRFLIIKGHVYDSLDDDEESDQEDIYTCYFEPYSKYLYILDTITFISSLIILIYFPIYLAKEKYFCNKKRDINTIIFYYIDIIYIIDLIINFYRSYYNYDEILIKNKIFISIHYLKTWLILDLISSIPLFSIIKYQESKCIGINIYKDSKLSNNGNYSHYFNINPQNIHYLLMLIKIIKTFKTFSQNLSASKIQEILFNIDFFFNWGHVFLDIFYFSAFLNLAACFFIFIGRNSDNNWISLYEMETNSFFDIYLAAIQYLVETVTTVGYGELTGKSMKEIIFQIIMLIFGTCIYSWLISTISNYVKKMNEVNIKYKEKFNILEDIKLYHPNFSEKLYETIFRLLHYRKYHEEETEIDKLLDSLPNSLKNTLLVRMNKVYTESFSFFKDIENRDFIVQVISKLSPVLGIKGDVLIKEGEFIDDIIFIKNGILSLEVWIDIKYPKESVINYLNNNIFNKNNNSKIKNKIKPLNYYYKDLNRNNAKNKYFYDDENSKNANNNIKKIKILSIRKNEHFGDVYMFLNKKSPLYVRVKSKKADLLLLKKIDALNISHNYPDIWKKILKKPLANSTIITNLTLKMLSTFCNLNGIKLKIFKKRKNQENFPPYYLIPSINYKKLSMTKIKLKNKKLRLRKTKTMKDKNAKKENIKKNNLILTKENDKKIGNAVIKSFRSNITNENFDNSDSAMTLINNYSNNNLNCKFEENKIYQKEENEDSLITSKELKKSKNKMINNNYLNLPKQKKLKSILKNKKTLSNSEFENDSKNIKKQTNLNAKNILNINNIQTQVNNEIFYGKINDEIYPGENFNIKINKDEIPNLNPNIIIKDINIKEVKEILPQTFINNVNIIGPNYLNPISDDIKRLESKIKELELEIKQKRYFNKLSISLSESIEINSSYENINKMTNYIYILDSKLRNKTKDFLNQNMKIPRIILNSKYISSQNISSVEKMKQMNENGSSNQIFLESLSLSKTNSIYNGKISNNLINNFRKSFVFKKQISQAETFKNKIKNLGFEKNIKNERNSMCFGRSKTKNFGLSKIKEVDKNKPKKKRHSTLERKIGEINPNKKRKKEKELDIISINIKKSSQNLNQPDIFYAGLFSELIFKGSSNYLSNQNKTENHSINKKEKE